jgi:hypothetical protein
VGEKHTSERICHSPPPPGTRTRQARDGEGEAYLPNLAVAQVFCIEYDDGVYTEFIIANSVSLLQALLPCFGLAIMRVNYTLLIHKRL